MRNSFRKSPLRCRSLNIESLESRELLCASPFHIDSEQHQPVACSFDFPETVETDAVVQDGRKEYTGSYNIADAFTLHSDPVSNYRIYLDFNGFVSDKSWNDFDEDYWSLDADKTAFSDAELESVIQIWQIVSDKFSSFDVDVTTDVAMFDAVDNPLLMKSSDGDTDGWGIRVVLGAEGDFGGVAYLNSFDWDTDIPCYAVDYGGRSAATVIVHEVGHTLGLSHDGLQGEGGEYYGGHNVTDVRTGTSIKWGPIMGAAYGCMEQFSIGDYISATQQEDDLSIITQYISYRPDRDIEFVRDDTVEGLQVANGTIGTSGDVDSVTFTVGEKREYTFEAVTGVTIGTEQVSSLYYVLTLTNDTTGEVVFQKYSPLNTFQVSYEGDLSAGVYTLSIAGAGVEPTEDLQGFSDYGSIGAYTITIDSKVFVDVPTNFRLDQITWNSALLRWDAPIRPVTGYVLEYKKTQDENWTTIPIANRNATSYLFNELEPDTAYEFRLRAVNGIAISEWTSVIAGRTTDKPPTVPFNFRSPVQTADSILLNWDFQSVTSQTLQYRQTGQTVWSDWTVKTTDTSTNVTGLSADTSYDFRINAANSGGMSGWAVLNGVRTKGQTSDWSVPATPVGFSSTAQTTNSVTLVWESQTGVTRYELQYKEAAGTEWNSVSISSVNTTKVVGGLRSGTNYQFQLRAVNAHLLSDWQTIDVTTKSPTPAAPANVKAEPLATRNVNLTWDAVPGATHYQIYWKNTTNGKMVNYGTTEATSFKTTRVPNGSNTFYVYAWADALRSTDSATVTTTVNGLLPSAVPTNLKAEPLATRNVNLTWDAVPGATHYQVYWKNTTSGKMVNYGTTEAASFKTTRVPNGSNTFYVYAWADDVRSNAYATVTTTVNGLLPSAVPTNVEAEPLATRNVNLTWDTVSGATHYQIYWKNTASGKMVNYGTTEATSFKTTRVPNGSNTFYVYAWADDVRSNAYVTVTTMVNGLLPSAVPTNFKAEPLATRNVNLTWDAVAGATHYQIFWKNTSNGKMVGYGTTETTSFSTTRVPNGSNTFYVFAWADDVRSNASATVTTIVGTASAALSPLETAFVGYSAEYDIV